MTPSIRRLILLHQRIVILIDISILYKNIGDMSQIENSVKYAYSDARKKSEDFCETEMNKATGGMPLPFDMKSFL